MIAVAWSSIRGIQAACASNCFADMLPSSIRALVSQSWSDVQASARSVVRCGRSRRCLTIHFPAKIIAAVLILGLLGGLFHFHESAAQSAACACCHAGIQAPVSDLANILSVPFLADAGSVEPARAIHDAPAAGFSAVIPRAPPV